ncbi:MAG: serine hydroxymethyltransferase [Candidatus Omnitrophica bacterium]|nr:serine hydroxymethyltransferase [Candidatus Omnitrophota bacterium]
MKHHIQSVDPEIYKAITSEIEREEKTIELIASENFAPLAVLEAQGSVMTNKYAEGYPASRWYGGCEFVDDAERLAIERAKELFGAEHANVQAHSGTQANMAVYFAALEVGDTVMAMDLACGGHLSHGHPHNFSGRFYKIIPYGVNRETERIDMDEIRLLARRHRPKMILVGASAYSRVFDFKEFRDICDSVGAYLFVDMAHIAGLIAAGVHPSPFPYADFVTTTTHKTLRGPRGGVVFCRGQFAKKIDGYVFPGIQGGPLMHVIAAKAIAFKLAATEEFKAYQRQVAKNAKALAEAMASFGYRLVSGGTDNHLALVDLTPRKVCGRDAQVALEKAGITVNKNLIPYDRLSPMLTSGIRLGAPAVTTRGMKENEMKQIVSLINEAILARSDDGKLEDIRGRAYALTARFPIYPELK